MRTERTCGSYHIYLTTSTCAAKQLAMEGPECLPLALALARTFQSMPILNDCDPWHIPLTTDRLSFPRGITPQFMNSEHICLTAAMFARFCVRDRMYRSLQNFAFQNYNIPIWLQSAFRCLVHCDSRIHLLTACTLAGMHVLLDVFSSFA